MYILQEVGYPLCYKEEQNKITINTMVVFKSKVKQQCKAGQLLEFSGAVPFACTDFYRVTTSQQNSEVLYIFVGRGVPKLIL